MSFSWPAPFHEDIFSFYDSRKTTKHFQNVNKKLPTLKFRISSLEGVKYGGGSSLWRNRVTERWWLRMKHIGFNATSNFHEMYFTSHPIYYHNHMSLKKNLWKIILNNFLQCIGEGHMQLYRKVGKRCHQVDKWSK